MNKQITEDYVSYEIAKLLKEKGFDVPTMYFFSADGTKRKFQQAHYLEDIAQPTHQMALKWLREVHKIHISIDKASFYWNYGIYDIKNKNTDLLSTKPDFSSYEQAVDAALLYVLKNLI